MSVNCSTRRALQRYKCHSILRSRYIFDCEEHFSHGSTIVHIAEIDCAQPYRRSWLRRQLLRDSGKRFMATLLKSHSYEKNHASFGTLCLAQIRNNTGPINGPAEQPVLLSQVAEKGFFKRSKLHDTTRTRGNALGGELVVGSGRLGAVAYLSGAWVG